MENYYTVSQKSDCGRVHEVLGLGVRVRVYERFIYLLIYLFYFIFNSGPVPRA